MITNEIKIKTSELCQAMVRNINDNFLSVSFAILLKKQIKIKIILLIQSNVEVELIYDLTAEFVALQTGYKIYPPIVSSFENDLPLECIIFSRFHSLSHHSADVVYL